MCNVKIIIQGQEMSSSNGPIHGGLNDCAVDIIYVTQGF